MWFVPKKKYLELQKENEQLKTDKSKLSDEYKSLMKQKGNIEEKLDNKLKYIDRLENENAKYINENASLNNQISQSIERENTCFKVNRKICEDRYKLKKTLDVIRLENKRLKIKSNTLERLVLKISGEREGLGKAFNVMNNRLWCNEQSKDRVRNLSNRLLNGEKIPHKDLGLALRDISMYMGGGEHLKFEEKVKANG